MVELPCTDPGNLHRGRRVATERKPAVESEHPRTVSWIEITINRGRTTDRAVAAQGSTDRYADCAICGSAVAIDQQRPSADRRGAAVGVVARQRKPTRSVLHDIRAIRNDWSDGQIARGVRAEGHIEGGCTARTRIKSVRPTGGDECHVVSRSAIRRQGDGRATIAKVIPCPYQDRTTAGGIEGIGCCGVNISGGTGGDSERRAVIDIYLRAQNKPTRAIRTRKFQSAAVDRDRTGEGVYCGKSEVASVSFCQATGVGEIGVDRGVARAADGEQTATGDVSGVYREGLAGSRPVQSPAAGAADGKTTGISGAVAGVGECALRRGRAQGYRRCCVPEIAVSAANHDIACAQGARANCRAAGVGVGASEGECAGVSFRQAIGVGQIGVDRGVARAADGEQTAAGDASGVHLEGLAGSRHVQSSAARAADGKTTGISGVVAGIGECALRRGRAQDYRRCCVPESAVSTANRDFACDQGARADRRGAEVGVGAG